MASDFEHILRFEMGYTPEDFGRRMPELAAVTYDPTRTQFEHIDGERSWRVRLSDPGERVIGALRLPRMTVEVAFRRYELSEINAFMSRFHAHFRRGGG